MLSPPFPLEEDRKDAPGTKAIPPRIREIDLEVESETAARILVVLAVQPEISPTAEVFPGNLRDPDRTWVDRLPEIEVKRRGELRVPQAGGIQGQQDRFGGLSLGVGEGCGQPRAVTHGLFVAGIHQGVPDRDRIGRQSRRKEGREDGGTEVSHWLMGSPPNRALVPYG